MFLILKLFEQIAQVSFTLKAIRLASNCFNPSSEKKAEKLEEVLRN